MHSEPAMLSKRFVRAGSIRSQKRNKTVRNPMTELETMLLRQFRSLSEAYEKQFELLAMRSSDYEKQLLLLSARTQDLWQLVERLAMQLNDLSARLEHER